MARRPPSGFLAGCLDIVPMAVGAAPFGIIIGATGVQVGLEPWEVVFMGAAVFAGAAQFIALDMWDSANLSAATALAIVGTTLMVNLRHILMGGAAAPFVRGIAPWARFPFLYTMADENWAMAMKRAQDDGFLGPLYLLGLSVPFYLNWLAWSYIGTQIGDIIGDPARYGFDFVFTAVFVSLVVGFWKINRQTLPILVSAIVASVVYHMIPGPWYIFAGSIAGVVFAVIQTCGMMRNAQ